MRHGIRIAVSWLLLCIAPVASAQAPEPRAPDGRAPEPRAPEKETPSPAPDRTQASDLGAAPPHARGGSASGLSPLNPSPKEFPTEDASARPTEYDALLTEVAALRSRVAALTATLFKSKLSVRVETEGDSTRIARVAVTLDDGVVFQAGDRFVADDGKLVYEHAVAPGHHVVGIEIERYHPGDATFRTWQTSRFSVLVPENKKLMTEILLEEDSDMGGDFAEDQEGEYELSVALRAWVDS